MQYSKSLITASVSLMLFSGCASRAPTDISPTFLKGSERHQIEGMEGFMPMSNIRYAGFSGQVKKGWESSTSIGILGFESEQASQEVRLIQNAPTGEQVTLNYLTSCESSSLSLGELGWLAGEDQKDLTGELSYQGQIWQLGDNGLTDRKGNKVTLDQSTVRYNGNVVAEYYLNAYMGGFKTASFVWLDEKANPDERLLATTLLNFAISFEALDCSEDQDDY